MVIYEEILREFQKRRVKYVLAGGVAFNLLGGYRNTMDLDVLVLLTDANLRKVVDVLGKAGYKVKQPVDPMKLADEKTRDEWIKKKHMKAFNFYKNERSYEEVDIIIDSPVDFDEAIKRAKKIKIGSLTLPVISAEDLIKMKKAAGREKDLLDIKELKMLMRLK
jgi:hypothetical protein